MCDTAMHHEALRKKRVLERKQVALQRMAQDQPGECAPELGDRRQMQMQMEQSSAMNAIHAEQNRVYGGQGVDYHRMQYDHSRNGPTRPLTWNHIERQLKHEAKVLRDNNLYMGHTSAFKDLYNRGMLDPSKPY